MNAAVGADGHDYKNQTMNDIDRREFLKRLGMTMGSAAAMVALGPLKAMAERDEELQSVGDSRMTYRVQHGSGENISLLGLGMMRMPRDNQELVNKIVDYALAHGVNYIDTAPMYGGGLNERITGEALSRHPRERYYIATKMSNYDERTWSFDESKKIYEQSFSSLRVDYIDYYLLHGIGLGGMHNFEGRFIKNGFLDFLVSEREAGRIRHLGFSYHGDVSVFDWLVDRTEEYHWDMAQIQMNYLDWRHASLNKRGIKQDADAEYLYNKLEKAGIQTVVMEPLRGGALTRISGDYADQLKALRPEATPAEWAFRWVGSHPNILTTLSGMNQMEFIEENVKIFSPLESCTDKENELMEKIADSMAGIPTIPCTTCAYCMPCPYGVNIPGNFSFYNDAMQSQMLPLPETSAPDYAERQAAFASAYRKAIPVEARANQCVDCEACLSKCPQQIRIPNQMGRIVSLLRKR